MVVNWNICRFCHDGGPSDQMVRYGMRHYAHFACYIEAGRPLADLPAWQVRKFPYRLLKEHGLLAEAERLIESVR